MKFRLVENKELNEDYPEEILNELELALNAFLETVPIHEITEKDLEDWD